jgi:3',5'-cyclic AMP phosphodiesterase CpdA
VVPVPGNHEVQTKTPKKKALVANEQLWRDNMGDLILDDARFTALVGQAPARFDPANNPSTTSTAAADLITTDQKQLSYSFDVGAAHFVVINTDPVGRDTHAPAAWLAADLRLASASGAKRFFVFGHKPAFSYQFVQADGTLSPPTSGLDAAADLASPGGRDEFWSLIEQYGATYFCGHEHLYDVSQPKGQAWQVIVGSGGSPFEATAVAPADRTYAYAVVRVHRSGRTVATTYGFGEALGPTKLLKRWELR